MTWSLLKLSNYPSEEKLTNFPPAQRTICTLTKSQAEKNFYMPCQSLPTYVGFPVRPICWTSYLLHGNPPMHANTQRSHVCQLTFFCTIRFPHHNKSEQQQCHSPYYLSFSSYKKHLITTSIQLFLMWQVETLPLLAGRVKPWHISLQQISAYGPMT
jgi:hypothetical protein